ncbi:MAG: polymer-forming cytoskeletal protein [Patescibacteria group bacterium]|nr:polymer-forming cytoskeletal protein [Patescibacteria group bacterium]
MKRHVLTKLLLAGILVGGLALVPAVAQAATARGGDLVSVGRGQVVKDDLYAVGENITISGTVEGDVVAAGSEVTVTGRVTGNVWAVGATVRITGTVDGSVRAAGSDISVPGRVGRDVIFLGGNADIERSGRIGGDVIGYAERVTIAGAVGRNATVGSDALLVSGTVGGDLSANTGNDFQLADTARITGDVTYTGTEELVRGKGSRVGGSVDFTRQEAERESFLDRLNGQIFWFLASVLLLLAILLYARRAAVRAAALVTERPGISLLAGIAFILVMPLLASILLISLVGLPLSFFTVFGYVLILYSAKVFVALAVGGAAVRRLPDRFWPVFGVGTLGLALYYLLTAIPGVGAVVVIGTVLFGTGAQLLLFKELFEANRKKYGA